MKIFTYFYFNFASKYARTAIICVRVHSLRNTVHNTQSATLRNIAGFFLSPGKLNKYDIISRNKRTYIYRLVDSNMSSQL